MKDRKGFEMSRTYTVTEYDKDDIEKLDSMTKDEIIGILEHIARGWLPQNHVCGPQEFETYNQNQYDATRLHKAVRKAIEILEKTESEVSEP